MNSCKNAYRWKKYCIVDDENCMTLSDSSKAKTKKNFMLFNFQSFQLNESDKTYPMVFFVWFESSKTIHCVTASMDDSKKLNTTVAIMFRAIIQRGFFYVCILCAQVLQIAFHQNDSKFANWFDVWPDNPNSQSHINRKSAQHASEIKKWSYPVSSACGKLQNAKNQILPREWIRSIGVCPFSSSLMEVSISNALRLKYYE